MVLWYCLRIIGWGGKQNLLKWCLCFSKCSDSSWWWFLIFIKGQRTAALTPANLFSLPPLSHFTSPPPSLLIFFSPTLRLQVLNQKWNKLCFKLMAILWFWQILANVREWLWGAGLSSGLREAPNFKAKYNVQTIVLDVFG